MYCIQCFAGYFVPVKKGKFEIHGFSGVINDISAASRITLIDDKGIGEGDTHGRILASTHDQQKGIIDIKGKSNQDVVLEQFFPMPIKTRNGLSVVEATNLVGGTLKVYIA